MTQPIIFISYSHKDEREKNRLLSQLGVLQREGLIGLWSDDRIGAGAEWKQEISEAIAQARVAILLISANFLTSDFILGEEVSILLKRRKSEGLTVFPVIAKACAWQEVDWLIEMNVRPKNGRPIWGSGSRRVDEDLAAIAKEVAAIVRTGPHITPTASDVYGKYERTKATYLAETDVRQLGLEPRALSVCTITRRRTPRIDKTIELLNRQPYSDFEYLIVDGYYFHRKEQMELLFKQLNPKFEIRYLPPKPTRWGNVRPALCNARNTYLTWARGEIIIELDDCCVDMCPDFLTKHLSWNEKGYAVSGTWKFNGEWENRRYEYESWQEIAPDHFYGGNRSFRLEKAIQVNGYEELLDGEQGQDDIVLALMMKNVGVKYVYDPELWIQFDSNAHSLTQLSPDPLKVDSPTEDWAVDPKKKLHEDGTYHYANEVLTSQIRREQWREPKGNKFNLRKLREIPNSLDWDVTSVQKDLSNYVDPDPKDWRDGEDIANMSTEAINPTSHDIKIYEGRIEFAFISTDCNKIALVSKNSVQKYDRQIKKKVTIEVPEKVTCILLSPMRNFTLIPTNNRKIKIYDSELDNWREFGSHDDVISAIAVSKTERYIITGAWDKVIKVWNYQTGELISSLIGHTHSITSVAITDDERYIISGSSDGQLCLWDLDSTSGPVVLGFHQKGITSISTFNSGNDLRIISGSKDKSLKIWDIFSKEEVILRPIHSKPISHVLVSPIGDFAISVDLDGELFVWNLIDRLVMQRLPIGKKILHLRISKENNELLAITEEGYLRSWEISSNKFKLLNLGITPPVDRSS